MGDQPPLHFIRHQPKDFPDGRHTETRRLRSPGKATGTKRADMAAMQAKWNSQTKDPKGTFDRCRTKGGRHTIHQKGSSGLAPPEPAHSHPGHSPTRRTMTINGGPDVFQRNRQPGRQSKSFQNMPYRRILQDGRKDALRLISSPKRRVRRGILRLLEPQEICLLLVHFFMSSAETKGPEQLPAMISHWNQGN